MSAHDVLVEIMPLIEPVAAQRDDTLARPPAYEPDKLYGWPVRDVFAEDGDGSLDRNDFTIQLAWAEYEEPDMAGGLRDRAVSDAIKARMDSLRTWVRGHRSGTSYHDLQVTGVDYQPVITNSVRGFVATLQGWQLPS